MDGERGKKEEGKAPDVTAPKANKASVVLNTMDLHMPSMWPLTAADTHREMVITKHHIFFL